jgi:tetratricopeptide (TPR) repeat protein
MTPIQYYLQIPSDYYVRREKNAGRMPGFSLYQRAVFSVVMLVILGIAARASASDAAPASEPTPLEHRIDRLIDQLRSDDASTRESAAAMLTAIGSDVRPAILKLVKSDDPALRQQAEQILLNLPWYVPYDPPDVKAALSRYATAEVALRQDVILQLANLDQNHGVPALIRLLREDPNLSVQWTIVSCLRERNQLDSFRDVQPPMDDAPLLAACAYAQYAADPVAALDDLKQCASLELANPTDAGGEFDFVIQALAEEDVRGRHYDAAADWRRKEFLHGSPPDRAGVQTALLELFALEGLYGPLKGLDADIALAGKNLSSPKIQFALSVMYERANNPVRRDEARHAATQGNPARDRSDVGDFLAEHGWDNLAETEYRDFLNRTNDGRTGQLAARLSAVDVHFRLANLAIRRGDDESAAENKELALQMCGMNTLSMVDSQGHISQVPVSDVWAEVYWRYLRAAVAKHDEGQTHRRLEQLLELKPKDGEIAIDVVPLLEKRGQNVDANLLFQWAYDDMKKQLDADPRNADSLNSIAWLCAECDRKLPQARQWAQQAAMLLPNNAAILDTLADTNFRLGHYDESVRLETQASSLDPDDAFMHKQLERFKAAATGQTRAPATRPG